MGIYISIDDWKRERAQERVTNDAENEVRRLLSRCFVLRQNLFAWPTKEECLAATSEVFDINVQARALATEHDLAIMQKADGQYSVGRYIRE